MQTPASSNYFMVIASIMFTAIFWGSYGPLLQLGHKNMADHGRLRPFICVGIAYFFVAIVGPLLLMFLLGQENKNGFFSGWTMTGIFWSLAGGAAGALGAFGIILALNYGGTPTYVMPLVFGCAPVVSTALSLTINKQWAQISPFFAAGLILVAAGAITVLVTAPSPGKPAAPKAESKAKESRKKTDSDYAAAERKHVAEEPAATDKESSSPDVDQPQANS